MNMKPSTLGAIAGAVVAVVFLVASSITLLNSDGANYKVLVAVWLWLLPAIGFFCGLGYLLGKLVESIAACTQHNEGGAHGDVR